MLSLTLTTTGNLLRRLIRLSRDILKLAGHFVVYLVPIIRFIQLPSKLLNIVLQMGVVSQEDSYNLKKKRIILALLAFMAIAAIAVFAFNPSSFIPFFALTCLFESVRTVLRTLSMIRAKKAYLTALDKEDTHDLILLKTSILNKHDKLLDLKASNGSKKAISETKHELNHHIKAYTHSSLPKSELIDCLGTKYRLCQLGVLLITLRALNALIALAVLPFCPNLSLSFLISTLTIDTIDTVRTIKEKHLLDTHRAKMHRYQTDTLMVLDKSKPQQDSYGLMGERMPPRLSESDNNQHQSRVKLKHHLYYKDSKASPSEAGQNQASLPLL